MQQIAFLRQGEFLPDSEGVVLRDATKFLSNEEKAKELIRLAPAYAYVSGTLMTAKVDDSMHDVVAQFNNRKKRG